MTKRWRYGEMCWNALDPFIKRGNYYAGKTNDGKFIAVYYGSELGYPIGDTILSGIRIEDVDSFIAALQAAKQLKS